MSDLKLFHDSNDCQKLANLYRPGKKIFFIGIGGISMCGLAELAQSHGLVVAGSDMAQNDRTSYLSKIGIQVFNDQKGQHFREFNPDLVVYSLAIQKDNPDYQAAQALDIPLVERAVFLGLINRQYKEVINIAGTNGKSTTTSLCSLILLKSGLDPTVHLGAELKDFKTTVRTSQTQDLMVSEACEFGRSLLHFYSTIALILNIDHDHLDCYPTLEDVIDVFTQFAANLKPGSCLILPAFDKSADKLLAKLYQLRPELKDELKLITFGYPEDRLAGKPADLVCQNLKYDEGYPEFDLVFQSEAWGHFKLNLPGQYNVENAMGAILAAMQAGANLTACRQALAEFTGPEGRFTEVGSYRGARIIADYAHYPASVALALQAAQQLPHKRFFVAFEPLTHSRAKLFLEDFADALLPAENIVIKEVFDNREADQSFSASHLVEALAERGKTALFLPELDDVYDYLKDNLREGDLAIIMGPANVRTVADRLVNRTDHFA